jgi:hypothetical protein
MLNFMMFELCRMGGFMQILYCDKCGYRIPTDEVPDTSVQFEAPKLCKNCKPVVETVRPSEEIRRSHSTIRTHRPSSAQPVISANTPARKGDTPIWPFVAGLCTIVAIGLFLMMGSKTKPAPVGKGSAADTGLTNGDVKRTDSPVSIDRPSAQAAVPAKKDPPARIPETSAQPQPLAEVKTNVQDPGWILSNEAAANAGFSSAINQALASAGAKARGGVNPDLLNDGAMVYDQNGGYVLVVWPGSLTVTFPKPTELNVIRFLLWDKDERFYRYKVETRATATDAWSLLIDMTQPDVQRIGWQNIAFAPRQVESIRVTGTFNSKNNAFHIVELESYLIPRLKK